MKDKGPGVGRAKLVCQGKVHVCNHPDDVEEPLRDPFRTLFPKEYCRLGGQAWDEPLTLLEM